MKPKVAPTKIALSLFFIFTLAFSAKAQCDAHKAILNHLDKAREKKNPELLAEAYHANAQRHTAGTHLDGLKEIQEEARKFYEGFPNAKAVYEDFICAGNKIVRRWTGSGTPKDFDKEVTVRGITIYQIENGKIIAEWEEMSQLSLMQQMGFELKPPGEK